MTETAPINNGAIVDNDGTHINGIVHFKPLSRVVEDLHAAVCFVRSADSLRAGKDLLLYKQERLFQDLNDSLNMQGLKNFQIRGTRRVATLDNFGSWNTPDKKRQMKEMLTGEVVFSSHSLLNLEDVETSFRDAARQMFSQGYIFLGNIQLEFDLGGSKKTVGLELVGNARARD